MKKKLQQLLDECRRDNLADIDLKMKALLDSLDSEGLLEVFEVSEQPIVIKMPQSVGKSMTAEELEEKFVRPAAAEALETWLASELEKDICEMPYGEYLIIVDNTLERFGEDSTYEDEMEVVDQMQCDLELPHVCVKCIRIIRDGR